MAKAVSDFTIEVEVDPVLTDVSDDIAAIIISAAAATLTHARSQPAALTCLLTDDTRMRELNRHFRALDKPTDVLSFPAGMALPDRTAVYLGDLAYSWPTALQQATTGGHSIAAEIQLLTVHGTLHLLGHDHAGEEEKAAMWVEQTAVLKALGADITEPTPGSDLDLEDNGL